MAGGFFCKLRLKGTPGAIIGTNGSLFGSGFATDADTGFTARGGLRFGGDGCGTGFGCGCGSTFGDGCGSTFGGGCGSTFGGGDSGSAAGGGCGACGTSAFGIGAVVCTGCAILVGFFA